MKDLQFDYGLQVWAINGVIARCGHKRGGVTCIACQFAGVTVDGYNRYNAGLITIDELT